MRSIAVASLALGLWACSGTAAEPVLATQDADVTDSGQADAYDAAAAFVACKQTCASSAAACFAQCGSSPDCFGLCGMRRDACLAMC